LFEKQCLGRFCPNDQSMLVGMKAADIHSVCNQKAP
jgi:hypothetical protein